MTITGKGGYKGTVVKYFKILPAKQKIKAVAPLTNSFAVTWTKDSGVTGYQVMYGTKSDLSDGKSVDIMILSIKLDTLTARILKLSSDGHS